MNPLPALSLSLLALSGTAFAADWPQFRGPNGDNSLPDAKIATSFPEDGPKVLWAIDVSEGYGGAAIADGEVFFMDRVDQEKDVLTCANLADGKVKWTYEHAVPGRISHPGSRTVPTVREDVVYGSGGFGHVYCVDRKSGEKRWVLDVAEVFDAGVPRFGYAVHPVIHGDLCIIAPIGEAVGVAAVDRKSGETVWKAPSVGESQSSPIVAKILGRDVVTMPGARRGTLILNGLDPKDGKVIFEYSEEIGGGIFNAIPNLTMIDSDTAIYTGGYGKGTRVLKFSEAEGKLAVRKTESLGAGATIHPPLVVGERIYITAGRSMGGGRRGSGGGGFRGRGERGGPGRDGPGEPPAGQGPREGGERPDRPPRGPGGPPQGGPGGPGGGGGGPSGLISMDSSGQILWSTDSEPGFGGGSIINAGGIIVSQDGDDGTLRLIEAGPAYKELASGKVFRKETGRELWAPMALADGKLVMRSQSELVCVDLSPAGKDDGAE